MTLNNNQKNTGDGKPSPVSFRKRLTRFAVMLLLVGGFVYLAPHLESLPGVGETISVLRESGVYTGAWYWDVVDECSEGMAFMRERLQ